MMPPSIFTPKFCLLIELRNMGNRSKWNVWLTDHIMFCYNNMWVKYSDIWIFYVNVMPELFKYTKAMLSYQKNKILQS